MARIILALCLLISSVVSAQPGYTNINSRYKWIAGGFDSSLILPRYNGVPSGLRSAWNTDGQLAADTANNHLYVYSGGAWIRLANYSDVSSYTFNNGLVHNSGFVGLDSNGVNPLTRNVLIDADGNDFTIQNASVVSLESNNGGDNSGTIEVQPTQIQIQVEESGTGSNIIYMNKDSTKFQFFKGQANIDSLREASNMTNKAVMVWEKTTGRWERIDKDSVGGGGSSGITVGTTTITSGTNKRIPFNNSGVYSESANLTQETNQIKVTGTSSTTPLLVDAHEDATAEILQVNDNATKVFSVNVDGVLDLSDNSSAPSTPASGYGRVYSRADSLRFKNDAGTEFTLGAGGGATTALDNLASTSINSILNAQTGIDLGSTTTPFRNLRFYGSGTYGSHSFTLGGTPTSHRAITFPDANITVARTDAAQTFTGDQTYSNRIMLANGSSASPSLSFASATNFGLYFTPSSVRMATNSGDALLWYSGGTVLLMNFLNSSFGTIFNSSGTPGAGFIPNFSSTTTNMLLRTGSATAGTAPLKFTSGTNLTTPEAGAMEYDGSNFFLSPSTTRKRIPLFTNATPGNGEILIGNGTDFTKANITSTNGSVTVTNGAGTIDLSVGTESTYTPTLTNTTNVAASTAYVTHYQRIGDVVRVWGEISIDATASLTVTELGISLPIATAIGNTYELAGTGFNGLDNTGIQIQGDVTNNRAKFILFPQTDTNNKYSFSFSFKYIAP